MNQFKKIIDQERQKNNAWYRKYAQEIIKNLRNLIKDSIPVDALDIPKSSWDSPCPYFVLGTMLSSSKHRRAAFWPESVKRAIRENDGDQLRSKASFYYKDKKYYSYTDYFLDSENKLRAKDKYYKGKDNVAYPKEKYIFATNDGQFYIKKQDNKQKYEKKIPNLSSITIRYNKWGKMTREFVWNMFEYDGKSLPDLSREQYGFSFEKIKKLKFVPTKEHLKILEELGQNPIHGYVSDNDSLQINIYCKEKKHKKAIAFLQRICSSWKKIRIKTIQEKLDALSKVADLKEEN